MSYIFAAHHQHLHEHDHPGHINRDCTCKDLDEKNSLKRRHLSPISQVPGFEGVYTEDAIVQSLAARWWNEADNHPSDDEFILGYGTTPKKRDDPAQLKMASQATPTVPALNFVAETIHQTTFRNSRSRPKRGLVNTSSRPSPRQAPKAAPKRSWKATFSSVTDKSKAVPPAAPASSRLPHRSASRRNRVTRTSSYRSTVERADTKSPRLSRSASTSAGAYGHVRSILHEYIFKGMTVLEAQYSAMRNKGGVRPILRSSPVMPSEIAARLSATRSATPGSRVFTSCTPRQSAMQRSRLAQRTPSHRARSRTPVSAALPARGPSSHRRAAAPSESDKPNPPTPRCARFRTPTPTAASSAVKSPQRSSTAAVLELGSGQKERELIAKGPSVGLKCSLIPGNRSVPSQMEALTCEEAELRSERPLFGDSTSREGQGIFKKQDLIEASGYRRKILFDTRVPRLKFIISHEE